jgi:3-oxoadipate enol-lactonase
MAFAELKDAMIHYELAGVAGRPVVMLSNSLGTNFSMWDPQVEALAKRFRVLRYDQRGHGNSSAPPGPYSMEQLGRDVVGLLDTLKLKRVHFCGLSMGGQTGMWLGVNAPERIEKLVLCNTGAKIGTPETWNARIESVRSGGMKAVAGGVLERWLTPEFRAKNPAVAAKILQMLESTNPEGYAACCAAVRDFDYRKKLGGIRAPTQVIAGTHDSATPPAGCRFVADEIYGARYIELNAAHLSNVEDSERFTEEVEAFLSR